VSTWVLLRGLTRESGHWGAFPALLRASLPSAQIVLLDLPGNGALNAHRSPTRIDAMARWCDEQMRSRGIAPPFHLLAVSMGAMVAIEWAVHDPSAIAGCVLINTSLRPFDPWYRRLRPASYPRLLRFALGGARNARHEAAILALTSRNPAAAGSVLNDWVALRAERPVSHRNALRQLLAAACYRAPASPPEVPLLVLTSRGDALVHPRCSQQLAQRWHAQIAVHPWAGHDLPLDDGPWVAEQIAGWLRKST
jgi:pimeloyl-ACP methyl ester carboxylesterase